MTAKHVALVVEDDLEAFEEDRIALAVHEIQTIHVDNKKDALAAIDQGGFCLLLVDLEIKPEKDDLRGHISAGHEVIRYARNKYPTQTAERHFQLPIIVVSGHLGEGREAREVFLAGASDIAEKKFDRALLPDRIKECMRNSGRLTHDACVKLSSMEAPTVGGRPRLEILGEPDPAGRSRSFVTLGGRRVSLTDGELLTLMRLVVASCQAKRLHTDRDFGSKMRAHGARLVSRVNHALRDAFQGDVVENAHGGWYFLSDRIELGTCDLPKLRELKLGKVVSLAEEAERHRKNKKEKV